MNQNFSDINAQTVHGPLGSYNNSALYLEQHIHQTPREERNLSIDVLLSQINAIVTRPQTCLLDDRLKESVLRTALAIPDLSVIKSIVLRSPPQTVRRGDGHGSDLEAIAEEISKSQAQLMQELSKANASDEVLAWQQLPRLFGSLGSRFADIGWFVGALQMSYHDVQIRCALANSQSQPIPGDLSKSSITPAAPPYLVEYLDAIARLLHHRSLYSANQFCFNDARKASKEAIRIQHELCMHDSANSEYRSTLLWMQRHLSSFYRQDAAYNVVVCRLVGNKESFPADVTKLDIARGALRPVIQVFFTVITGFCLIATRPIAAGAIFATGWATGEYLSFINRRS